MCSCLPLETGLLNITITGITILVIFGSGACLAIIIKRKQLIIPEESHNLGLLEKPEVFNAAVLEFLSKYS